MNFYSSIMIFQSLSESNMKRTASTLKRTSIINKPPNTPKKNKTNKHGNGKDSFFLDSDRTGGKIHFLVSSLTLNSLNSDVKVQRFLKKMSSSINKPVRAHDAARAGEIHQRHTSQPNLMIRNKLQESSARISSHCLQRILKLRLIH